MDEDQVDQSTEDNQESEDTGSRESERAKRESSVFSTIGGARQINVSRFVENRTNPLMERIARLELNLATSNKNIQAVNSSTERSLIQINTSIVALQQSLKVISDGMDVSDKLEKIRDANDRARERQLAEQSLRDGKEQVVEKRMQSALSAPLRKIGAKARSILGSLVEFFNVTLLGFMGLKTVELISALASGNKEKLDEIKDKILKQLAIAGGIFVAINAGFAIALRSLLRLGGFITRVAAANLLKKPIDLLINLVTSGRFGGAGPGGGRPTVIPPNQPQGNRVNPGGPSPLGYAFFYGGAFYDEITQNPGQVPEALVTAGARTGVFGINYNLIMRAFKGRKGGGVTGFIGSLLLDQLVFRDLLDPLGDIGGGFIRERIGMAPVIQGVSMETQRTQQLFSETDDDKVNVFVVNGEQRASISSSGTAEQVSTVPGVSSANPDNPYILNSIIEYNIIGV